MTSSKTSPSSPEGTVLGMYTRPDGTVVQRVIRRKGTANTGNNNTANANSPASSPVKKGLTAAAGTTTYHRKPDGTLVKRTIKPKQKPKTDNNNNNIHNTKTATNSDHSHVSASSHSSHTSAGIQAFVPSSHNNNNNQQQASLSHQYIRQPDGTLVRRRSLTKQQMNTDTNNGVGVAGSSSSNSHKTPTNGSNNNSNATPAKQQTTAASTMASVPSFFSGTHHSAGTTTSHHTGSNSHHSATSSSSHHKHNLRRNTPTRPTTPPPADLSNLHHPPQPIIYRRADGTLVKRIPILHNNHHNGHNNNNKPGGTVVRRHPRRLSGTPMVMVDDDDDAPKSPHQHSSIAALVSPVATNRPKLRLVASSPRSPRPQQTTQNTQQQHYPSSTAKALLSPTMVRPTWKAATPLSPNNRSPYSPKNAGGSPIIHRRVAAHVQKSNNHHPAASSPRLSSVRSISPTSQLEGKPYRRPDGVLVRLVPRQRRASFGGSTAVSSGTSPHTFNPPSFAPSPTSPQSPYHNNDLQQVEEDRTAEFLVQDGVLKKRVVQRRGVGGQPIDPNEPLYRRADGTLVRRVVKSPRVIVRRRSIGSVAAASSSSSPPQHQVQTNTQPPPASVTQSLGTTKVTRRVRRSSIGAPTASSSPNSLVYRRSDGVLVRRVPKASPQKVANTNNKITHNDQPGGLPMAPMLDL